MKNLFDLVLVKKIQFVTGGCNKDTKCCDRLIKSVYFEYKVFNPIGKNNNCFFKCLEKILGNNLNIKQIRKDFDLPTDTQISVTDAYKIIRSLTDKPIYIIDWEQNEELNKNDIYILLKNDHYFVVKEFNEIISKKKKLKEVFLRLILKLVKLVIII